MPINNTDNELSSVDAGATLILEQPYDDLSHNPVWNGEVGRACVCLVPWESGNVTPSLYCRDVRLFVNVKHARHFFLPIPYTVFIHK